MVRSNSLEGLYLDPKAAYRSNVLTDNNGGDSNDQVHGGVSLGENLCGGDSNCP